MNNHAWYWSKPSTKCRTTPSRISRTSSAVSLSRVSGERARLLPQAAPHRRQKCCKLFGMQSVSDSRRVIAVYDPKVHLAPWHNDRPFVLGLYDRRIKTCWGCHTTFAADARFVVPHQELREFWKKGVGRTMVSTTSFYHCNMSCISPRQPYFDLRSLALSPETLLKLTADDVREI